jgi:RNA-directed DNA polymerase
MGLFDWVKKLLGGRASGSEFTSEIRNRDEYNRGIPPVVRPPARAQPPAKQVAPNKRRLTPVDIGKFAPITRDEALFRAKWSRFLWTGWWGRRDLIPPAADARTLLIDQAMAGQGLIAPEELAHLHSIGDEMLRLRPSIVNRWEEERAAAMQAAQAVALSKEERLARKAQKKAEAAKRKENHAAQVRQRKATDIHFLGRGVSKGLADRRSHPEKLTQRGLPVLGTPTDVALALKLTIPRLRWLAFHHPAAKTAHYTTFSVPKKSGGQRLLASPKKHIRAAQTWILENILSKLALHPAAHGFVATRSTLTNAAPHVGKAVLVNTDLEDFFPSITFPRVKGIFEELGYSPAVATILALICTESPRRRAVVNGVTLHIACGPRALPQGACTSPALSNLAARRLDSRLSGVATKLGWTYTRYADDASFSATGEVAEKVGYLLARIRHISQEEGFRVKESKTRILRRNQQQSVTGIVVNDKPTTPRETRRRLRAILHGATKTGLASQNRAFLNGQAHTNFVSHVDGMISYIQMVQPEEGAKLRAKFQALA